jgi:heat shock protein HslJ
MVADETSSAVLEFKEVGSFHMTTGCGELAGNYVLDASDENAITFEVMMTTLVEGCTDAQVRQGLAVEDLIMKSTSFSVDSDSLTIAIDSDHDATFSFQPEGN